MLEATNFLEDIINKDLESGKITEVVTRFPPEPNGYLHIGHAKSLCINFGIAKKYGGRCNLRFDDTNPTKEEVEYVNSIMEDIKYLGFEWSELHYASDYFEDIFSYAVKLIKAGLAYVCDYNAEEIRQTRGTLTEPGKNSPYRDRSIEENLKLFNEMRGGKYADGEKVLRAKIDMASPNINMRDPVIYRILRAHHHRTGDKWLIYPMYDFTHPISDALEGITHSICTLEFEDHRPLYDWVIDACGFEKKPQQIEFARLNLTRTIMSKRYLKKLVDEKYVDGWFDPRMPTLSGVRHRGYPAESIRDFCDKIGVAKANSVVDIALLEHCVRDYLNGAAERVMTVIDPLKVVLLNFKGEETLHVEVSPKDENSRKMITPISNEIYIERDDFRMEADNKFFRLKPDGYVRLKGAFIIKCVGYDLDENGEVKEVRCEYVESSRSGNDTSGLKVKGVIHFVDAKRNLPCTINRYDYLLNEEGETLEERVNRGSKRTYNGFASVELKTAKSEDKFQFIRNGYFVLYRNDNKLTFNEIVPLKSGY